VSSLFVAIAALLQPSRGAWEDGTKAAKEEGAVELIQVAALGTLSLGWVAGVVVAARQPHVQDASDPAWKPLLGRWRLQT